MNALVTGVNGQLGYDIVKELRKRGYTAIGSGSTAVPKNEELFRAFSVEEIGESLTRPDAEAGRKGLAPSPYIGMDITDAEATKTIITALKPDAVFHCSAWTAVDAAEDEENRKKVYALNVVAPGNIAKACSECGAKMIYPSTDYVFDGKGSEPWRADCTDFSPVNYYGETKLWGERAVSSNTGRYFIVRIAWVFGVNGKNFIKTMINVGKTHDTVRVVNDQIGTPTYTPDLARLLVDMAETDKYGVYHATNEGGYISWYDFCVEFYRQYGLDTKVIPVSTAEYGLSKAARPYNSRLDKSKLVLNGFEPLPVWQDAVARYLREADI